MKAIFITGAASGIGLATAKHFAQRGWRVGLADIDEPGLARAVAGIGPGATAHRLDVRDRAQWDTALAAFTTGSGGRLDVLVNNAGVARMGWVETQSDADVDAQVDINLKGVIKGAQAGIEYLAATPGAQLVNVASVAGLVAPPQMSVYAATKFAVRGLSQGLDVEFSRLGVTVKCIMPWFLETPLLDKADGLQNGQTRAMLAEQGLPIYRVEEASQAIWEAVHGGRLEHLVGARARQIRAIVRWAPGLVRKQFLKAMAASG